MDSGLLLLEFEIIEDRSNLALKNMCTYGNNCHGKLLGQVEKGGWVQ